MAMLHFNCCSSSGNRDEHTQLKGAAGLSVINVWFILDLGYLLCFISAAEGLFFLDSASFIFDSKSIQTAQPNAKKSVTIRMYMKMLFVFTAFV